MKVLLMALLALVGMVCHAIATGEKSCLRSKLQPVARKP
jgi:hypothetical protein